MAYGFELDEINTAKVAAHGLTRDVVEGVFFAADVTSRPGNKTGRYAVYGTVGTRFICVVFRLSADTTIRVVTAYRLNPRRLKR